MRGALLALGCGQGSSGDRGGMLTTVRTDGWRDLDFALYSIREITP